MPLTVTDRARETLKQVLEVNREQPEQVLRLLPNQEGAYQFALDTTRDGDQVVEHDGSTIMVVADEVSSTLSGATLDVRDTEQGPALTLAA